MNWHRSATEARLGTVFFFFFLFFFFFIMRKVEIWNPDCEKLSDETVNHANMPI